MRAIVQPMNASSNPQQEDLASVTLAPGFRLPFFPMRPRLGLRIRTIDDVKRIFSEETDYDYTLKLNGDRACVGIIDGDVFAQNRHGARYKMTIDNLNQFKRLAGSWLFDGEIYKKRFLPFEAIVVAGKSISMRCPTYRKSVAMEVSSSLKIDWLYGRGLDDVLSEALKWIGNTNPVIEGIVGKRKGSSYVPMGSSSQQSIPWVKNKWSHTLEK